MNGPEVVAYAMQVLEETSQKSRNVELNKVRHSQFLELKSALVGVTPETDLEVWESRNRYKRQLAVAILNDLKPGWNRK